MPRLFPLLTTHLHLPHLPLTLLQDELPWLGKTNKSKWVFNTNGHPYHVKWSLPLNILIINPNKQSGGLSNEFPPCYRSLIPSPSDKLRISLQPSCLLTCLWPWPAIAFYLLLLSLHSWLPAGMPNQNNHDSNRDSFCFLSTTVSHKVHVTVPDTYQVLAKYTLHIELSLKPLLHMYIIKYKLKKVLANHQRSCWLVDPICPLEFHSSISSAQY